MRNKTLVIAAICSLAALAVAADGVTAAPPMQITVRVSNGTAGGGAVAGDMVTVQLYEGSEAVRTLEAAVDPNGVAQFRTPRTEGFGVHCGHEGVGFRRGPYAFVPHQTQYEVELTVYDTSADRQALEAPMHHLIVRQAAGVLRVVEYMQLVNPTDRVIKPVEQDQQGRTVVLPIHLPRGYENFQVRSHFDPAALVFTEQGFYDTMPIAPGKYTVQFTYDLPITGETMKIAKELTLASGNVVVFTAAAAGRTVQPETPAGEVKLGDGTAANYYRVGARAAGEAVTVELAGLEAPEARSGHWIVLAGAFAAILAFAIFRMSRAPGGADRKEEI